MLNYQRELYDYLTKSYCLENKTILEIGCSDGTLLNMLSGFNPRKIVGIDINPFYARENILTMNAECMDFESESFDIVISVATFEHIMYPDKALREIYRILKYNGEFYIRFAPIWTAINGHHYNIHSKTNSIIPPWGHLYMSENQMADYLEKQGTEGTKIICDYIYHSTELNRWDVRKYLNLFESAPYKCHIQFIVRKDILKYYKALEFSQKKYCPIDVLISGLIVRSRKTPSLVI